MLSVSQSLLIYLYQSLLNRYQLRTKLIKRVDSLKEVEKIEWNIEEIRMNRWEMPWCNKGNEWSIFCSLFSSTDTHKIHTGSFRFCIVYFSYTYLHILSPSTFPFSIDKSNQRGFVLLIGSTQEIKRLQLYQIIVHFRTHRCILQYAIYLSLQFPLSLSIQQYCLQYPYAISLLLPFGREKERKRRGSKEAAKSVECVVCFHWVSTGKRQCFLPFRSPFDICKRRVFLLSSTNTKILFISFPSKLINLSLLFILHGHDSFPLAPSSLFHFYFLLFGLLSSYLFFFYQ